MSKLSKMLKEIVDRAKVTNRGLARAIGIDHASLYRSLQDNGNPESKTIEKILDYLGYDIKFIKRKEVNPIRPKPSRLRRNQKREVV